jgi:transcriptional regulator with XRE-family HTH domain
MAKPPKNAPPASRQRAKATDHADPVDLPESIEERRKRWRKGVEPVDDPLLIYMGKQVLNQRKRLGLTQIEVSQRAGCTSTSVFLVEAARHNMTIKSMQMLAQALEMEVGDFFPRQSASGTAYTKELGEEISEATTALTLRVKQLERIATRMKGESDD